MKGYKALHWDWSARPSLDGDGYHNKFGYFKYKIGGTYQMDVRPVFCEKGFHFCQSVSHAYVWYPNHFDIRICEIDTGDNAIVLKDTYKCVSDRITIVRELTPREIADEMIEEDVWCRNTINFDVYSTVCTACLYKSIQKFKQHPGTYVLWHDVRGRDRCPLQRELSKLEKRAEEWLAVLNTLKQEEKS